MPIDEEWKRAVKIGLESYRKRRKSDSKKGEKKVAKVGGEIEKRRFMWERRKGKCTIFINQIMKYKLSRSKP